MEPIISPWWFYLANVCDVLSRLFKISYVVTGFVVLVYVIDNSSNKSVIKTRNIFIITTFVFLLLSCVIPTKDTVYQMIAASVVTENNINYAENNIVEFVDKIAKTLENAHK